MVIVAIFTVGVAFLAGLYITAWTNVPADYRAAQPGVPARSIRLACRDFGFKTADWSSIASELRALDADFLLLTGLSRKDAHELAAGSGMRHGQELQAFYAHGCAILGRHRLHKGQVLAGSVEGACVVMAEPVIDGRRFVIACMDLPPADDARASESRQGRLAALVRAWRKQHAPPLIVGGDFGGDAQNAVPVPLDVPSSHFLTSPHWRALRMEGRLIELRGQ
jgi:hypothetical protein